MICVEKVRIRGVELFRREGRQKGRDCTNQMNSFANGDPFG